MAGMYAALLLDELGIKHHIFEASGERVGGRVLTHYFNNLPHILYDATTRLNGDNLLCYNQKQPVTRNEASADNALLGFDQFFTGPEWDYFKDENGRLKPAQPLLDAALEPFTRLLQEEGIDPSRYTQRNEFRMLPRFS